MKQHFVPKFIVKNFAPQSDPNGRVYFYDSQSKKKKVELRNPASVFVQNHIYSVINQDETIQHSKLEHNFAHLESKAAPILSRILKNEKSEISKEETAVLGLFVYYQAKRNPNIFLNPHLANLFKELMEKSTKNEQTLLVQNKKFITKNAIIYAIQRNPSEEVFNDTALTVLKLRTKDSFIVSSKSVIGAINCGLLFPVHPKMALCLHQNGHTVPHTLSTKEVRAINKELATHSTMIASHSQTLTEAFIKYVKHTYTIF